METEAGHFRGVRVLARTWGSPPGWLLLLSLPQEMIVLGSGLLYPPDLLLLLGILFTVFDFLSWFQEDSLIKDMKTKLPWLPA